MRRILMLALLLATSLGMGQDAQQQTQKTKVHGFKARLCAASAAPDSPAFDRCMYSGFGKPRPSQPRQQAATAPQQPAPPQVKLQEPITAKVDPVQAKTQEPLVADTPAQAKTQATLVMDTPAQAKTQEPFVIDTPAQARTQATPVTDTPAQAKIQATFVIDTPAQAKTQATLVTNTPAQAKKCIEYMTTASGAQTCLRWTGDQDQ